MFIIGSKDIFKFFLNHLLFFKFFFWHKCWSIEFELFFLNFLNGRYFLSNYFADKKNEIFSLISFSLLLWISCDRKIHTSDSFLVKEVNNGSFIVSEWLKLIKLEIGGEVIDWRPERAGLILNYMFDWFGQEKSTSQTDHEHKSQEGIIRLWRWEVNIDFMISQILVNVSKHGSIMVRVEPWPWWKSQKVVLTIKLETFDVRFNDSFVFWVSFYIFYAKSGFIIFVSSFCDSLILNLEVFNILRKLVNFRNVLSTSIVGVFIFVVSGHLNHVFWSSSLSLQNHFLNHFCLKSFTNFQQFVHILPINFSSVVDKLFMLFQIRFVT